MSENLTDPDSYPDPNQEELEYELQSIPPTKERVFVVLLVAALYISSCFMTALVLLKGFGWGKADDGPRNNPMLGGTALILGCVPPFTVPWSANIALLIGMITYERKYLRTAEVCGYVALGTSLLTILLPVTGTAKLREGYFVWQMSIIVFAYSAWSARSRYSKLRSSLALEDINRI
ncbi:hypothetical protein KIH39_00725 [Telmatocola sphagniphila]|uniref:Uncharacterized protein n=1 Tax=Telmatocola sphagniphila TaxID=1123043 RepID=A0A8E6B5T4_9BACT|nr:hypothetical protein [Telmatocola sphagniphila]QVL32473.1 hypothetical protein KIH39_00725 [Telmatocola sphagniphila]